MHSDEVPVDAALVQRLVASQFPEWASLPVEVVLPWGTDNALFRLGDELLARLPRRELNVAGLEKERHWLPRLAPSLPVAIPEPLAAGMPDGGYPFSWSVYRWIEGRPGTAGKVRDEAALARDLAQVIAALERIDPTDGPSPGRHNWGRGEPLEERDHATREAIATLADRLDAHRATAAWVRALAAPAWRRDPVWLHGDLDSRNLLVDERGRLCGVIDFGCLGVGDPACDVAAAWKLFSGESRDIFRATLAVDDATWERSRGWALSQALMALAYYTLETNAVLVEEATRWLDETV